MGIPDPEKKVYGQCRSNVKVLDSAYSAERVDDNTAGRAGG